MDTTGWLLDETYVKIPGHVALTLYRVRRPGRPRCSLLAVSERPLTCLPRLTFFPSYDQAPLGGKPGTHVVTHRPCQPFHNPQSPPSSKSPATRASTTWSFVSSTQIAVSVTKGSGKSRLRPMRGLKSFECATRPVPWVLDAIGWSSRRLVRVPPIGVCEHSRTQQCRRAYNCRGGGVVNRLGQICRYNDPHKAEPNQTCGWCVPRPLTHPMSDNRSNSSHVSLQPFLAFRPRWWRGAASIVGAARV